MFFRLLSILWLIIKTIPKWLDENRSDSINTVWISQQRERAGKKNNCEFFFLLWLDDGPDLIGIYILKNFMAWELIKSWWIEIPIGSVFLLFITDIPFEMMDRTLMMTVIIILFLKYNSKSIP